VTAYGYPFVAEGGAMQLKSSLMEEVKGLVTSEIELLKSNIREELNKHVETSLLSLTKGVGEFLQPYESLKAINVEELNEAIKKVNRLPF
jgi:hypothetical protein